MAARAAARVCRIAPVGDLSPAPPPIGAECRDSDADVAEGANAATGARWPSGRAAGRGRAGPGGADRGRPGRGRAAAGGRRY